MSVSAISALTSSSNSSPTDQTSAATHAQRKHAVPAFKGNFATAATDAFSKMATSAVSVSSNVAAALNTLKPII